jgi:aryl-alcohol dehydrogenase-like predicted oxidoreductase
MTKIPRTDLDVSGLCFGGNVFGWTADRDTSFEVLDAYVAGGGNFIDTADVYMATAPGNSGGESETIIGEWLAARGNRDEIVIATKVGKLPGLANLKAETIREAADASLQRLGVDHIDLYYSHGDDPDTPLEEMLGAFGELVEAGKVSAIAASNYSGARLAEALATAEREGLPRFVALQPGYNLMDREYEDDQRAVCAREDLACFPYYGLAKGFLTGKYRPGGDDVDSPRAEGAKAYLDARGEKMLAALDEVAGAHDTEVAAVALAWLRQQETVLAPIASARNTDQLKPLLDSMSLTLGDEELARLTAI